MCKFIQKFVVVFLSSLLIPVAAQATSISMDFYKISNNNVEDIGSQLGVTVYDNITANNLFNGTAGYVNLTSTQFLATFTNNVGIASNIAEVYVDDGTIVSQGAAFNSLGGFTNFITGTGNPGELPENGNASPPFITTLSFGADVAPGPPVNGVNHANDILGLAFNLQASLDFDDVLLALANGNLRFGVHVRSIGVAGGSDSYVTNSPVPVPAAIWLFGSGLAGFIGLSRKSRAKA